MECLLLKTSRIIYSCYITRQCHAQLSRCAASSLSDQFSAARADHQADTLVLTPLVLVLLAKESSFLGGKSKV